MQSVGRFSGTHPYEVLICVLFQTYANGIMESFVLLFSCCSVIYRWSFIAVCASLIHCFSLCNFFFRLEFS